MREIEVALTWGDYVTVPPVPEEVFVDQKAQFNPAYRGVQWQRIPGAATIRLPVPENGRGRRSSRGGRQGGNDLAAVSSSRRTRDLIRSICRTAQNVRLRALTVTVVNRRKATQRRFGDVTFAFQVRLEVRSAAGLYPRSDMTGFGSLDTDAATADLHYRDVAEYAIGCNASASWTKDEDGEVRTAFTDFLPSAEVERVEPNERIGGVEFEMEKLAALATVGADALADSLAELPRQYESWLAAQEAGIGSIPGAPQQATAKRLIASARMARDRIAAGIKLLRSDPIARLAFRAMNEAIARAARQREAILRGGQPAAQATPKWRPFQLAFMLLNLRGLQDPLHDDREIVDLLFFPTGGGKTEAYLGLAAWTIAHRRITNSGKLGVGVAVLMRYTLRLLTLDQLSRAAGVVCALELMRGEPAWLDGRQEAARRLAD